MAGSIGTRKLKVTIDGDEHTAEVSVCEVTSQPSDSDFTSFAAAAAGGARDYFLHLVAVQDGAAAAFWDKVWSHAGETVTALIQPYGNSTPSATEPHFEGDVTIKEPDGVLLGGEANGSTSSRFTIDVLWPYDAKPEKITSAE